MAGPTQKEAKRQISNKKLRESELGKIPLKRRLSELLKGSHNLSINKSGRGMQHTIAVEKERTKLAKLLKERRENGERGRTRRRRSKPKATPQRTRAETQRIKP